jgi:hypothetical protein
VRAARYAVVGGAGLVDAVQSDTVAGQKAKLRNGHSSREKHRTSRIARKKDSILPAENPRAGAVWSKTEPMALHEGYAS